MFRLNFLLAAGNRSFSSFFLTLIRFPPPACGITLFQQSLWPLRTSFPPREPSPSCYLAAVGRGGFCPYNSERTRCTFSPAGSPPLNFYRFRSGPLNRAAFLYSAYWSVYCGGSARFQSLPPLKTSPNPSPRLNSVD